MARDIQILADQIFIAVKGYLTPRLATVKEKLGLFEGKQYELIADVQHLRESIHAAKDGTDGKDGAPGADGRDGAPGEKGVDGKDGAPGADGAQGVNGKDGRDGVDGKDGAQGERGAIGADGKDGAAGRDGVDGKDGAAGRDGVDGKDGANGVDGKDGADVTDAVYAKVHALIAEFLDEIPVPKDGAPGQPGRDGVDGKDGAAGRDGVDGKDGEQGIPGEKGFDGEDGDDGVAGLNGKDGSNGVDGKDGAPGERGADGKDGANGADGKDADVEQLKESLEQFLVEIVAEIPAAKDGAPGSDGRDGRDGKEGPAGRDAVHLEPLPAVDAARSYARNTYASHAGGTIRAFRMTDPIEGKATLEEAGWMTMMNGIAEESEEMGEDERTLTRTTRYTDGRELVRSFKLKTQIWRGVWVQRQYDCGDTVTWGGSQWHAIEDNDEKPVPGCKSWKLSVKRGSDGKDGKDGERGPAGPMGRANGAADDRRH